MTHQMLFPYLIVLAISICFLPPSRAQSPPGKKTLQDTAIRRTIQGLGAFIDQRDRLLRFSGVVLVDKLTEYYPDSMPLFLKACGKANMIDGSPVSPNTRFITASIAKTFVAVAIMQLAESGKIELDSALSLYIPEEEYPHSLSDHITIRQLLTHTAGLGDVIKSAAFRSAPDTLRHLSQLVRMVRDEGAPGNSGKFKYGDSDYILLGSLIERISGEAFSDYMLLHVFAPTGMVHTSYDMTVRPENLAHGYTTRDISNSSYSIRKQNAAGDATLILRPNDGILPGTGVPGAVAYTTAEDLLKFARALFKNSLINQQSLNNLTTGKTPTGDRGPNAQYGYGFFVGYDGKQQIISHGGTGPGIDNGFDIYPDLGYVVIILSNLDPPASQDIRQYIRDGFSRAEL
jgi:CubicO group peptidase (beta-lactamase class C family)